MEVQVNLVGVVVATLASMVVGSVWYAKPVFGKTWMKLVGLTDEKMQKAGWLPLVFAITRGALLASVLSVLTFVYNSHFENSFLSDALMVGVWTVVLVVPMMIMHDLFEGRRKKISLINGLHETATIMAMVLAIGVVGL